MGFTRRFVLVVVLVLESGRGVAFRDGVSEYCRRLESSRLRRWNCTLAKRVFNRWAVERRAVSLPPRTEGQLRDSGFIDFSQTKLGHSVILAFGGLEQRQI